MPNTTKPRETLIMLSGLAFIDVEWQTPDQVALTLYNGVTRHTEVLSRAKFHSLVDALQATIPQETVHE